MSGRDEQPSEHRPRELPAAQRELGLEPLAGDIQLRTPRDSIKSVINSLPVVGHVLGTEKPEERAPEPLHRPGDQVPVSGVYDLVDEDGGYLQSQITCHQGAEFPPTKSHIARERDEPLDGTVKPHYGYRLAYEAIHPAPGPALDERVHRSGEAIPASGVYNVVDLEDESLLQQRACVHGRDRTGAPNRFPELDGLEPSSYGFKLEYPAEHLSDR